MRTKTIFILSAIAIVTVTYSIAGNTLSSFVNSNESKLSWLSFNAGLEQAAKLKKKILVDVYTDWCGWCKKMDREIYTNERIISILNEKYVLVKLDAESSTKLSYNGTQYTEQEFAQALGINGYPTTVFFQPDAKPITRVPGYMEPDAFAHVLQYIGDDHYKNMSYDDFLLKSGKNE